MVSVCRPAQLAVVMDFAIAMILALAKKVSFLSPMESSAFQSAQPGVLMETARLQKNVLVAKDFRFLHRVNVKLFVRKDAKTEIALPPTFAVAIKDMRKLTTSVSQFVQGIGRHALHALHALFLMMIETVRLSYSFNMHFLGGVQTEFVLRLKFVNVLETVGPWIQQAHNVLLHAIKRV